MVTHIGLLTLVDTATEDDRRAISDGLSGLVGQIDGLLAVRVGLDLGLRAGNGDVLFLFDFDSEQSWSAYGAHPAHQAVIANAIGPVLAAKAFVQIDGFRETRR